jgi:hypothetical protein
LEVADCNWRAMLQLEGCGGGGGGARLLFGQLGVGELVK